MHYLLLFHNDNTSKKTKYTIFVKDIICFSSMKIKMFIKTLLILQFILSTCFAQNSDVQIHELQEKIKSERIDTSVVNSIIRLYDLLGIKGFESEKNTIYYLNKASDISKNIQYFLGIALSNERLGDIVFKSDKNQALQHFNISIDAYINLSNSSILDSNVNIINNFNISRLYSKCNNEDSSKNYLTRAINTLINYEDFDNAAYCNLVIAEIFYFYHQRLDLATSFIQDAFNIVYKYASKSKYVNISSDMLLQYRQIKLKSLIDNKDYQDAIENCYTYIKAYDTINLEDSICNYHYWYYLNTINTCNAGLINGDVDKRIKWFLDKLNNTKNENDIIEILDEISRLYSSEYFKSINSNYSNIYNINNSLLKSHKYRRLLIKSISQETTLEGIKASIISIENQEYTDDRFYSEINNDFNYILDYAIENIDNPTIDQLIFDDILSHILESFLTPYVTNYRDVIHDVNEIILPKIIKNMTDEKIDQASANYVNITYLRLSAFLYKSLEDYKSALFTFIKMLEFLSQTPNNIQPCFYNIIPTLKNSVNFVDEKIEIFKEISTLYYINKDYESSLSYCDSLNLYYDLKDDEYIRKSGKSNCYILQAKNYNKLKNDSLFLYYINQSIDTAYSILDYANLGESYLLSGLYNMNNKDYEYADSMLMSSISAYYSLSLNDIEKAYQHNDKALFSILSYAKNKAYLGQVDIAKEIIEEQIANIDNASNSLKILAYKYIADINFYFEENWTDSQEEYNWILLLKNLVDIDLDFLIDIDSWDLVYETKINLNYNYIVAKHFSNKNEIMKTGNNYFIDDSVTNIFFDIISLLDDYRNTHIRNNTKYEVYDFYFVYKNLIDIAYFHRIDTMIFNLIEHSKAQLLTSMFIEKNAANNYIDMSTLNQIENLEIHISNASNKGNKSLLQCFQNSYDTLMLSVEKKYPKYKNYKSTYDIVCIDSLQQYLKENSAMISYFIGDTTITKIFISKNEIKVIQSKKDSQFDSLVNEFINGINSKSSKDYYSFQTISNELYNILLNPFSMYINDSTSLIIIPDGNLYNIPFEALVKSVTHNDEKEIIPAEIDYLILHNPISYHYSATLWYLTKKRDIERQNISTEYEYFVAAPFSTNSYPQFDSKRHIAQMYEKTDEKVVYASCDTRDPMPATGTYCDGIKSINPEASISLTDIEANIDSVKYYCEKSRYVNLLTHGCVDTINNNTYLVFYDKESLGYSDLTIEDVFSLKMNADIVVLAACQSGIGKVFQGEGMMSFTRGLIYSGSSNVIYGLFKMNNKYMSQLVYSLYQEYRVLNNFSKSLQKAKISMIKNDIDVQNWSALILLGVN